MAEVLKKKNNMPGKHKSPLYKGISKNYKKMPKGQRGFKMNSPLRNEFVQDERGSSSSEFQNEHAELRKKRKDQTINAAELKKLKKYDQITEDLYKKRN